MQRPASSVDVAAIGRGPHGNDIGAVLSNSTLWAAFPHTITAAFVTAGTFVAGISAWWMVRLQSVHVGSGERRIVFTLAPSFCSTVTACSMART